MKLLYCGYCGDIFNTALLKTKSCSCGKTKGVNIDGINIVYGGKKAFCLGIDNNGFNIAKAMQQPDGEGNHFDAYVCCSWTESAVKIKDLEKMSDEEINVQIGFVDYPKTWLKHVTQKRTGIMHIPYLICKAIMRVELASYRKAFDTDIGKAYVNVSNRALILAKNIANAYKNPYITLTLFQFIIGILKKQPKRILDYEKIKSPKRLYNIIRKDGDKFYPPEEPKNEKC